MRRSPRAFNSKPREIVPRERRRAHEELAESASTFWMDHATRDAAPAEGFADERTRPVAHGAVRTVNVGQEPICEKGCKLICVP